MLTLASLHYNLKTELHAHMTNSHLGYSSEIFLLLAAVEASTLISLHMLLRHIIVNHKRNLWLSKIIIRELG